MRPETFRVIWCISRFFCPLRVEKTEEKYYVGLLQTCEEKEEDM